jgi:hypothetical protein
MTDFWTAIQSSPIASAMSGITIGTGTCPTYTLPIPFLHQTYTIDAQCTIADSISGTLRTIMIAVWLVVAAGIFLRA